MSHSEYISDNQVIASLKSEIEYLRKEIEKFKDMEKSVADLKAAYQSEAKAASRSRVLREAIMRLVEL